MAIAECWWGGGGTRKAQKRRAWGVWWGDGELVGERRSGATSFPRVWDNVWEKEKETELVYSVELSTGKRENEKMVRDH